MLGLMIAKLFGVKVVWTAHNLKNHESIYPNLDYLCTQFVAKNADVIISHCDIARELIVDYFGLTDGQKIITVPHGNYIGHYDNLTTSDEARAQLNLDAESVVYLFLGFIRPYKGVYELIDAFKKNNQAGAKLLIAGKTLNDEITRQLHARIDGNENIILHPGFVPDEKIQTYMNACDIVVLPYRDILTSGAAILAMSFAKAVIAVRIGCIGDVIKEGAGGFLYSKDNQEGLSEAMLKAYEAKEQLASMGKFNYEMCETWDWHSIAAQTIQAYQSA